MGKEVIYVVEGASGDYYASTDKTDAIGRAEEEQDDIVKIVEVDITGKVAFPETKVYPTIKVGV